MSEYCQASARSKVSGINPVEQVSWGQRMRTGVIIPLFKQSQYLIECVTSVLEQTLQPAGVVIVNDGCPNPSSDTLSRAIAAAWPERVLYVHQQNRGVGAARNTGVRALLGRWPEIEAVFPLDADNWLDMRAIELMAGRLASDDRPDWVYPDMQRFGAEVADSRTWRTLNPFRQIFRNQCDAGCLISRRLFDAGLFYDETLRPQGFEDWEFFLRAMLHGFLGVSGGPVGFYYRVRKNSMLTGAMSKHDEATRAIYDRHPELIKPWSLAAREHQYMPRFRFIDEELRVRDFSDPALFPTWKQATDLAYLPPITVLGSADGFALLSRTGMLRGLLFSIQHGVLARPCRIDFSHREKGIRLERHKGSVHPPALLAIQTRWLKESSITLANIESVVADAQGLTVGGCDYGVSSWKPYDIKPLLLRAWMLAEKDVHYDVSTSNGPLEWHEPSNTWFSHRRQVEAQPIDLRYPLTSEEGINVCFVVPWLRLGGVDQGVVNLAAAIKGSRKNARVHLLLTESGVVDFDGVTPHPFDSIVSVAHFEGDRRATVAASILRSMHIIINAHSTAGYQALPLLPRGPRGVHVHRPVCVSYLQIFGVAPDYRPVGFPYLALEYESDIDCFLVCSEQLRDFLSNSGVNEERIRIGRNAPVVSPDTLQQALLAADRKAARQAQPGYRFELLFAGRLDRQKGLSRLAQFMRLVDREGISLQLTIVGSATTDGEEVDWPSANLRFVEPTMDRAALAGYFERADGLILLSRAEGVPLVLLDAMAHGCVVIATDVGAVGELVVDGVNGFLCPSSGDDDDIARAALECLRTIIADTTGCRELRRRAVETAMGFSWDQVAGSLDEFLAKAAQA